MLHKIILNHIKYKKTFNEINHCKFANSLFKKKILSKKNKVCKMDTIYFKKKNNVEITIRIVKKSEIKFLNFKYRKKNKTTNILSFPATTNHIIKSQYIGDLIVCSAIIKKEAQEQHKSIESHWAHMIIHGTLHLLGYHHDNKQNLKKMKHLEIKTMLRLGFQNPYNIKQLNSNKNFKTSVKSF